MSSPWTERQGQVGDLRDQSKDQLQELLNRQEKILSNKRLLRTLPDKGKKIREFAERVQRAIELHDEEERKLSTASAARAKLQSQYRQATKLRALAAVQSEGAAGDAVQEEEEMPPVSVHMLDKNSLDEQQGQSVHRAAAAETMDTAAAGASLDSVGTKEDDLAVALDRVTLAETPSAGFIRETKDPLKSTARDNYFLRVQVPNKPHYETVLERTQQTSASRKEKFKPNQLPHRIDSPASGLSSPSQSSQYSSPLPAQVRRERDKKHLDDITAAKLPPLHHHPTQLLSLQESAALLKQQTKKQQELQAKLAAQKLSEGLSVSIGSYNPEGGPMAAYREVRDEGDQLSEEED